MSATLYLLPAPISDGPIEAALPAPVIALARRLDHFLVEDAKTARAFLKALGHPKPLRELDIVEIGHEPRAIDIAAWLAPLAQGFDIAIVSEAGSPAVADPGASIVAAAHAAQYRVRPLVGPSSILLALMSCGLEGQRFRFHGYLPIDAAARTASIRALERESAARRETQVFIETPYRTAALFDTLISTCAPATRIAIAVDIGGPGELIAMRTKHDWQAEPPRLQRQPAVFCLLA